MFFTVLIWVKWNDMSVASTISIVSWRNSLIFFLFFKFILIKIFLNKKLNFDRCSLVFVTSELLENVVWVVKHETERRAYVIVLQDGSIVVDQRDLRSCLHMKVIRRARVLVVVYDGRHERREYFQMSEPILFDSFKKKNIKIISWNFRKEI